MEEGLKHKHLARTGAFWCALLVPLISGSILAVTISLFTPLGGVCFSSSCVGYFFEVYKFPIVIVGSSLPLIAMVAALQRSKEASVQIEYALRQYNEAVSNNRFGNYLKHREGFDKLIDKFCEKESTNPSGRKFIVDSGAIYERFFVKNGFKDPAWAGQHDEVRMGLLDDKFLMIHNQLISPDFDFRIFVGLLDDVLGELLISYIPFSMLRVAESDGFKKVDLMFSGEDGELIDVCYALTDATSLYRTIKIYIGGFEKFDFYDSFKSSNVLELLAAKSDLFEIDTYDW